MPNFERSYRVRITLAFLGCTIERESIVPPKGRSIRMGVRRLETRPACASTSRCPPRSHRSATGTIEGIVAKQASAHYTPEATTWVKIKNRQYRQAVGREDFFDHRKA